MTYILNAEKPLLTNIISPLRPSIWANLLNEVEEALIQTRLNPSEQVADTCVCGRENVRRVRRWRDEIVWFVKQPDLLLKLEIHNWRQQYLLIPVAMLSAHMKTSTSGCVTSSVHFLHTQTVEGKEVLVHRGSWSLSLSQTVQFSQRLSVQCSPGPVQAGVLKKYQPGWSLHCLYIRITSRRWVAPESVRWPVEILWNERQDKGTW